MMKSIGWQEASLDPEDPHNIQKHGCKSEKKTNNNITLEFWELLIFELWENSSPFINLQVKLLVWNSVFYSFYVLFEFLVPFS